MTTDVRARSLRVIDEARALFRRDPAARSVLDDLQRRLEEPLRVALAGMVKAGKSTLLNALLGEHIAPTDAGECTRLVTWYRHADAPSITVHLENGSTSRLPVRRTEGMLLLELGDIEPDEVHHIEVGWPSDVLREMTLIDTPGIESLSHHVSARSVAFLVPDDAPSSADAIVYLMRHLHPRDVGFLEAFRDTAAGASRTVNAIAALSRADEIGSGRIDSLLSAGKVAARYEREGGLQSLALGVLPVAGLLAEGARTLRESEFAAFRALASMNRADRERLLVSSDRFVRPNDSVPLSVTVRAQLLARFGIYGVRLGTSLVRVGVTDSSDLAAGLVQNSGLMELEAFVRLHFLARTDALKARAVTEGVAWLLRDQPFDPASAGVRAGIEELRASSNDLEELAILSQARCAGLPVDSADSAVVLRIVGANGLDPASRLGVDPSLPAAQMQAALAAQIDEWRARSHAPLTDQATHQVCSVVIRSLEGIESHLPAGAESPTANVMLAGSPGEGRA